MRNKRIAQICAAAFVAAATAVWLSGCENDAGGQYREYSRLEAPELENSSAGGVESGEETPAVGDSTAGIDVRRQRPTEDSSDDRMRVLASISAQPPIEAPLPVSANAAAADAAAGAPTVGWSGGDGTAAPSQTDPPQPAASREVKVLVEQRDFKVEGPNKALRVTYDDIDLLKVLNMEPVTPDAAELMPDWLQELDGRRVRLRGFMYPSFQETGIPAFLLARDNQICCFGGQAKIYDLFPVRMRDGVTTDYIQNRPFDVVGVFHIDPIVEDGELFQLYRIDDAIVIDK